LTEKANPQPRATLTTVETIDLEEQAKLEEQTKDVPWIDSNKANMIFAGLIILNCLTMGFETDAPVGTEYIFAGIEICFLFFFTLEIALRAGARKCRFFHDPWNWFDVLVVGTGAFGVVLEMTAPDGGSASLSLISILRALRLIRLVRVIKLVKLFRELFLLIQGISNAMRALLWVMVLTILVLLVCSIFVTRMAGQSTAVRMYANEGPCADKYFTLPLTDAYREWFDEVESPLLACNILGWYGSVRESMFSLFTVMTVELY
jgi:voltage-gated sodium channel